MGRKESNQTNKQTYTNVSKPWAGENSINKPREKSLAIYFWD